MYEHHSEDEDYEDSRSEVSEPEDLLGQDSARRDEEVAEDSEEDMPLLADDSETESSTGSSDHFRGDQTTESSETSEDEEIQETLLSQLPINEGEWRHVRGNASKIREHMQEELERRQKSRLGTVQGTSKSTLAVSNAESHLPAKPGSRQRRRGPLRVIEICTWTCMMSITAASLGRGCLLYTSDAADE